MSSLRHEAEPVRACPLGCPEAGSAIGELATTMAIALSRSRYTLARCGCGQLLYLSPPPSPSDLHAMYVANNQFGDEYTEALVHAAQRAVGVSKNQPAIDAVRKQLTGRSE